MSFAHTATFPLRFPTFGRPPWFSYIEGAALGFLLGFLSGPYITPLIRFL
jgi:hypothetical protein